MPRRLIALLALALAVATAAGCGGDNGRENGGGTAAPDEAIARAATRTSDARSYRASFEVEYAGFTREPVSLTGRGVFDGRADRGRMTLDMSEIGRASDQNLGKAVLLFDGLVFYLDFPALRKQSPDLERWLRLDLEELGGEAGTKLGQLAELYQSDPARALEYLRGAGDDVKEVGEEELRGETTTHYRMTVDLDKVAKQSPHQRGMIERMIELSGRKEVPTDVWVDRNGRVRKIELAYENVRFPSRQKGDITLTTELYDFGVEADVDLPPAAEVTDLGDLLTRGTS